MNERPPAAEVTSGDAEGRPDQLFEQWFEEFKRKLLSAEHIDYVIKRLQASLDDRKGDDSPSDTTLLSVEVNQRFTEDNAHCPDINDDDLITGVEGITFYKTMFLNWPGYQDNIGAQLCEALRARDPRVQQVVVSAGDGGGYVLNEIRMTVLVDPSRASE